jgi:hypothetical protein
MKKQDQSFQIAGIVIRIKGDVQFEITKRFETFLTDACPEYVLEFQEVKELQIPVGEKVCEDCGVEVWKDEEGRFFRLFYSMEPKAIYGIAFYQWEQKAIRVEYLPEGKGCFRESGSCFAHIAWETLLAHESRAAFHAACVETSYGGILFAGPSGIGKSTQANLWCEHRNGKLINGDRPVLKFEEQNLYAYGSPYAGSSKCYLNEACQVKAIVLLKQGNRNQVTRIAPVEAFRRIYASMAVNTWDENFVNWICEMSEKIVACVPVYELECMIDINAVEVLEEVLRQPE